MEENMEGNKQKNIQVEKPPSRKSWPVTLGLFTLAWLFLTFLLFKGNSQRMPGWSRSFSSQVSGQKGSDSSSPGASPSPTIYVPAAAKATGDYKSVSFTTLSGFYFWNPVDYTDGEPDSMKMKLDKLKSKVPDSVLAYNGQKVAVVGFMIPIDEEQNFMVKTFVLAKNQMTCCYGATPRANDWIFATVPPNIKKVMDQMDIPLTVFGTLSIDPQLKDPSMPTLYRITVDKVQGPKKNWF